MQNTREGWREIEANMQELWVQLSYSEKLQTLKEQAAWQIPSCQYSGIHSPKRFLMQLLLN